MPHIWDPTEPTFQADAESAPIRENWESIEENGAINLGLDPYMLIWAGGDAVVPTHYVNLSGDATIDRSGDGQADTVKHVGPYALKVTFVSTAQTIQQRQLDTAAFTVSGEFLKSKDVGLGCYVRTSTASAVRLSIFDGVGSSFSTFHTGSGVFEWLSVGHTLNAAATQWLSRMHVDSAATAYFVGLTPTMGSIPPAEFLFPRVQMGTLFFPVAGILTVSVPQSRNFDPFRPFRVEDCQLAIGTTPATQAVIADLEHWDGAAWMTMFATKPQIGAGSTRANQQPDGTYRFRCFDAAFGTSITDALIRAEIEQVGITPPGSDLNIHARTLQFMSPLEGLRSFDDVR